MIELACHTKACAPPPAGVGGSMPMQVFYHLTDKANFKLNPKKVPADNALALRQREAPGLYVAKDSWDVEGWVNGQGYLRPFVVEIEAPKDVVSDERWGGEGFIPADRFGEVRIKRVIPIDAFAREVYGGPGWVESTVGKEFDSGEQPPEDYGQRPYGKEYKYDGPDVRDMPAERIKQLKADATKARRERNSGSFGVESAVIELACRSRECAPPPVGDGGSLPDDMPTSKPNISAYKGLFEVPTLGAIKKLVGRTDAEKVEHFAQYGIKLTLDLGNNPSWAAERYTNEIHGALYGLDQMAQRYPEAFQGMPVYVELGHARAESGLFRWPTPTGVSDREMTINVHNRYVLPKGTPIQKRRLYAAVVIHETGHVLTYEAVGRDSNAMASLAWEDRPQMVGSKLLFKGSSLESVSKYGASSIGEDIAESFTAHTLGIQIPDDVRREHVAQHIGAIAASGAARPDAIAYLYAMAVDAEDEATVASALIELACRSAECAPPPVGRGGSMPKGQLSDRVRDMVDTAATYRDAKTALPESVQTEIRAFMRSRETAFARAERDYRGKDAAPSATTTADFEAEYDALSALLPPEKGMVRRRTPEGERLAAAITETLPNAKVVFGSDVNGRIVEEAVGVMAQYPSAVRESIKCVVLGRDPNAVEMVGGWTRDTSVVAAWGGHADESGPYETLWLTPRMLGASDADTAAGIGLFSEPADMQSEDVTVSMAEPERRHKIAIAHEMGHVMHTMALSREPVQQRGIGRNMTSRMKEDRRTMVHPGGRRLPIMTTTYGQQNVAESVAESFGLAALKGYDNITTEQRAVVDNILDRAGLVGADRSSVTRLELAVADDEDEMYGKFEPITDTFEL